MKANVLHIVTGHLRTLKDSNESRYHRPDIVLFYIVPSILVAIGLPFAKSLSPDVYNASISVFAIFSALLLNVQIALFGVYQRGWNRSEDSIIDEMRKLKLEQRRELLGEINTNISYLILVSCVGVTIFLLFYVFDFGVVIEFSVTIYLYSHFLLTLLMVIKRAHAIFQKEYEVE